MKPFLTVRGLCNCGPGDAMEARLAPLMGARGSTRLRPASAGAQRVAIPPAFSLHCSAAASPVSPSP